MAVSIVGIKVNSRACRAPSVQEILTRHGSKIIMRAGVPDPHKEDGIITLAVDSAADGVEALVRELSGVEGVVVRHMDLA